MRTQETKRNEGLVLVEDRVCGYDVENANCLNSWREDAMNESLRGFAYAEYEEALIYAIRRNLKGYATLQISPNRTQFMKFVKAGRYSLRSLLTSSHRFSNLTSDESADYFGWYAINYYGEVIEIALPPCYSDFFNVVLIAQKDETLIRFRADYHNYSRRPIGRSLRYAKGWENAPDIDKEIGKITWDDIVLPKQQITGIKAAITGFAQSREAYERFGFAWRRGVLLVGPPGTGKTLVCKAAASALPDFPFLYVRDMHERENREAIKEIFAHARHLAPCILIIEDLDGLVQEGNRTVFLNEMDGFNNNNGLLVIASSNYPEKIDEAMLRRPSRFDQVFHFGLPAKPERLEYCRRILQRPELSEHLSKELDIERLIAKVAEKAEGFTPAYLKEAFISAALIRAQQGAMILDAMYADTILQQIDELKNHLKRTRNPLELAEMETGTGAMGFRR